MKLKIIEILKEEGYSDIEFCFSFDEKNYYFEAYTDDLMEVWVRVEGKEIIIHDRYAEESNWVQQMVRYC